MSTDALAFVARALMIAGSLAITVWCAVLPAIGLAWLLNWGGLL